MDFILDSTAANINLRFLIIDFVGAMNILATVSDGSL